MAWQLFAVLTLTIASTACAKSVIGMAAVGGTSHVSSVGRIGLELQARGHRFGLLVSSKDEISRVRLAQGGLKGVRQIHFHGPPKIGTEVWQRAKKRDPRQVQIRTERTARGLLCPEALLESFVREASNRERLRDLSDTAATRFCRSEQMTEP